MKLLGKSILTAVLILWSILTSIILYNRWRDSVFKQGYDHGAVQETYFLLHKYPELRGKISFPSVAFRACAYRYVNEDEDGWIEICQHESDKAGKEFGKEHPHD